MPTLKQRLALYRSSNRKLYERYDVPAKRKRDVANILKYGLRAPLSDEVLFVDPTTVKKQLHERKINKMGYDFAPRDSGRVIDGDWDQVHFRANQSMKFQACKQHFIKGITWAETGMYDYMMKRINERERKRFDGCSSLKDVIKRYDSIDRLFDVISREGRIRRMYELDTFLRREAGGILMHVSRDGELMRHQNGNHRYIIARLLKFPEIPVQVGVIHPDAIKFGAYLKLRKPVAEQTK